MATKSKKETMVEVCEEIQAVNDDFGTKATAVSSFLEGCENWLRGLKYRMPCHIAAAESDGSKVGFQRIETGWRLVVMRANPDDPNRIACYPLCRAPLSLKVAVMPKIPLLLRAYREQQLKLIAEIDNLADTIEACRDYGIWDDSQPEEFSEDKSDATNASS